MTAIGNTFFFQWEVTLMEWLQANLGSAAISMMSFFSLFGEELPLILIVGFIYWSYDKKLGRRMGLSAIMGLTWSTMIKNLVLRRRPYFDHENIKILRIVEPHGDIYDISTQGYSFPSAHSTNAVTVFGSLATNLRKRWIVILAIILPLLTGISRFVVGAHYPTDVMAGWLLGLTSVTVVNMLQERVKSTITLYGILLIIALPGFFYCRTEDYFTSMGLMIGFMGGTLLDDRFVHFENTEKLLFRVLRVLGGLVVYWVLNTLLKLPFSKEFLSDGSTAALVIRFARYAIVSVVAFGVYPMVFRFEKSQQTGKAA
ncbi:phosphatase PAP2 family protein [Oribacterium sp. P6A1]|uniref:phosphatase PAP2 family protein n=1 Tax=Oribacterium sp. P6A1 TaxID=1410612 RepID=UPI000566D037|nr:phosphatase PAP2 family protein [Oribacterium sp. P6A1]